MKCPASRRLAQQHRPPVQFGFLLRWHRAAPHILGIQPYATYVKGSHFSEAQAGINYNIALGWGLNVNYHNYMPEDGDNEHGVGAGITFHF